MTTFTVAITGVSPDPEVYIDVARARSYVGAMFGPAAAKWLALSPDAQWPDARHGDALPRRTALDRIADRSRRRHADDARLAT